MKQIIIICLLIAAAQAVAKALIAIVMSIIVIGAIRRPLENDMPRRLSTPSQPVQGVSPGHARLPRSYGDRGQRVGLGEERQH